MTPLDRIIVYLKTVDEVQILELLDLKTDDIIDRFGDIIEKRKAILEKELEILPDSDELDFDD
jgi:DNA-directed RNA polymerase subunit L